MIIYLVGMMGSGKTFIGKKLAERLNYHFADLDNIIESECGKSIHNIFNAEGESFFRQTEKKILQNLKTLNTVVSTGGGTACSLDNMDFMKKNGLTIFLNPSLEIIFDRLKNDKLQRPLISNLDEAEIYLKICNLYDLRKKHYQKAHLEIISENTEIILDTILNFITTKK
jgi:shikimate kinase